MKNTMMKQRMNEDEFWKFQDEMNALAEFPDKVTEDDEYVYVHNYGGCLMSKYDKVRHMLYMY